MNTFDDCLFLEKIYQTRQASMELELESRPEDSQLKFFNSDYKPDVTKDNVYLSKRRQALWLPFVHQLMCLINVKDFRNQLDLHCTDVTSGFVKSHFFHKFQQIRHTKV